MKTFISLLLTCFLSLQLLAQFNIGAKRISTPLKIDGQLDDDVWVTANMIDSFTTWQPTPGLQATRYTSTKIVYDDDAIYFGIHMQVPSRDSIMTELTQRDDVGNTDFISIFLDTYGNGTDAFEFIVSATGVQFDAKLSNNGEDNNWDAVWFSNVHLEDNFWSAEIKIPYSAIRFSNEKKQNWKINIIRRDASIGERSSWHPIDPQAPVFLAQMGNITGVENIKSPLRLSLSPYISAYAQNYTDKSNDVSSTGYTYNGGMDIKYGINDAFTLDMTLIPDFGQVQSDNLILNLSPFEVRYDERRQFFTEGTELFNKGGLFYSRRIGGSPIGQYDIYDQLKTNEEVIDNPANTQLINATKVSGRTGKGLGIGLFNAISQKEAATVRNLETGEERSIETSPLTNYNVIAIDQNLKNNSSVSFLNTNVWRAGSQYYDANVSRADTDLKVANQNININGSVAVSQKFFADADTEVGLNYEFDVEKISGNLNYGIFYQEIDDKFDSNDLGFLSYNNERTIGAYGSYQITQPFGSFQRANFWFNYNYSRLVTPNEFTEMHFNTGFWMQTKSFLNINLWANFEPESNDFYEPREWGRVFVEPSWGNIGFWVGTDNRKKLRLSGYITYRKTNQEGRDGFGYNFNPRYRFNDQFNVSLDHEFNYSKNSPRYVTHSHEEIIFGKRMRTTVENSINANFTFNNKMGMDFRLRHYWSKVTYNGFDRLTGDGGLAATDYDQFHDFTFNLFNIDLNFRWQFAPGSDLILNWKNNVSGVNADQNQNFNEIGYFRGLDELNAFPRSNSLSLRMVYYIDYQNISKIF